MRALILRPLCTVALVALGFILLRSALQGFTQREFQAAHDARVVVFGDSHGNDVPLRGVPRFNRQAQDLVSTWLRMRALADAQGPDSQVDVVVLTLWPMKFGPLAEDRMSGAINLTAGTNRSWAKPDPCWVGGLPPGPSGLGVEVATLLAQRAIGVCPSHDGLGVP